MCYEIDATSGTSLQWFGFPPQAPAKENETMSHHDVQTK